MKGLFKRKTATHLSSKREFIKRVSHEIQGNFFGVTSVCAMLKIAVENKEDTTALFEHLMNACHSYKYTLNNFLEYNRLEAGLRSTIFESISIRSLLARIINENQPAAAEKQTSIELSVSDEMPDQITSDEIRISQICTNLLTYAIESTRSGGSVLVRVKEAGNNQWLLMVEHERGAGPIASDFGSDPGFQDGFNLGLYITRHLIEDILKGKIIVSGEPNDRVSYRVFLSLG
jgi:two-component system, sensor histidine kinase and response regulator